MIKHEDFLPELERMKAKAHTVPAQEIVNQIIVEYKQFCQEKRREDAELRYQQNLLARAKNGEMITPLSFLAN